MSASFRRFEILLPRRFEDGQPVPDESLADALLEIEEHFGAVSCETQTTQGLWRYEGVLFRDGLVRIYVDAPDSDESRRFFLGFKERAKAQFQQKEIWLTTFPIDVL